MNAPMNPMAMVQNMAGKVMANNPIMAIMQVMRTGGNPMALMQQMAQTNPQMAQAMKMINGKNASELETMAKNLCKERGVNIEQVAQQLGLTLPQGK